jgi:hypothetical protein
MWTHTWMSFSSHTFTSLPLVHTLNPGFLRRHLGLCFLLVQEIFTCRDSRTRPLSYSRTSQIPEVRDSAGSWLWVFGFESLWIRDFEASQVQGSKPSRFRDSEASRVRDSKPPSIRDSETSWVPDSRSSWFLCPWKHISRISWTSTFRGWQVFLNSPTTVVAAIARVLFVCPASIVVFGRGFSRRGAFSSFLLFN